MAGNPPSAPPAPPAGTPPATPPPAGGQPAGGQPPAEPGKTLTQAEVDAIVEERLARDRTAREKELGIPLKDAKALIAAAKKAEDEKKSELEKLQSTNQTLETENKATKIELLKLRLAVEAQIPADKLPKILKYVNGSTEDEIKASLAEVKADMGLMQQPPPAAAQGAGNPGVPPATPGSKTKIWKQSEIKELRLAGKLTDELMAEIKQATDEGRVQ